MDTLDEGGQGWLLKQVRLNYWRVHLVCDVDDLIQDGYMYFHKVRMRYPDANKKHIMSLFKTSFTNHIHNLSKKQTRQPKFVDETLGLMISCEEAKIALLIAEAPPFVSDILKVMRTDEGVKRLQKPYRRRYKHRETRNERWCRIVGADAKTINLVQMVRNYLTSSMYTKEVNI